MAQLRAAPPTMTKLDLSAAIDQLESRVGFMAARGSRHSPDRLSDFRSGRGLDYYTALEFELHAKGNGIEPLVAGGRYDGLMTQLGSAAPIPAVALLGLDRNHDAARQTGREHVMTRAVRPCRTLKGRLQEQAEAFFTRAASALAKPRGARDYRGTISGLDNVEIAYLSASEIASQLAAAWCIWASPRRSGARKHRGRRQARAADRTISVSAAPMSWSRCAGLDRRPHHGRPRRCHDRLSRAA